MKSPFFTPFWTPMVLLLLTQMFFATLGQSQTTPLAIEELSTPRKSYLFFLRTMEQYESHLKRQPHHAEQYLVSATEALDLHEIPYLLQRNRGKKAAILLKAILDQRTNPTIHTLPNSTHLKQIPIPGTPLDLVRIEDPQTKRPYYKFSAHSITLLPELFGQTVMAQKDQKSSWSWPSGLFALDQVFPIHLRYYRFLGIAIWQMVGLGAFILLAVLIKIISGYLFSKLTLFSRITHIPLNEHLLKQGRKPFSYIMFALTLFCALYILDFQGLPLKILTISLQIFLSFSVIWLAYRLIGMFSLTLSHIAQTSHLPFDDHLIPFIDRSLKFVVICLGLLLTIQNFGINVASILAGLGLGGLAFALAAKDTAANIFGSLMILIDRPFKIGDYIIIDKIEGTVEEIGLRSTRVRTFYHSLISIPNATLANQNIDNMGQRKFRRIRRILNFDYHTPHATLQAFIQQVRQLLLEHPHTVKEQINVAFLGPSGHALEVLVQFHISVVNWDEELEVGQKFFFDLLTLAQQHQLSLTYPTQAIYHLNHPATACESDRPLAPTSNRP